jgi:hypothetical protein
MDEERPTLRNIAKEVSSEGYIERSMERAERRRTPWNLVFIHVGIGSIGCIGYALFRLMWRLHTWFYPEHVGRLGDFWADGIGRSAFIYSFLLSVPTFVAAVPLGLILTNALAWCIPPARKTFNAKAEGVKWASFRDSMESLAKIAMVIVPACLLLSFVAAVKLSSMR